MENYKMDRTIVSKSSFLEADDHVTYFKDKSALERLNAACFIINSVFRITNYAKVDRTLTDHKIKKNV